MSATAQIGCSLAAERVAQVYKCLLGGVQTVVLKQLTAHVSPVPTRGELGRHMYKAGPLGLHAEQAPAYPTLEVYPTLP